MAAGLFIGPPGQRKGEEEPPLGGRSKQWRRPRLQHGQRASGRAGANSAQSAGAQICPELWGTFGPIVWGGPLGALSNWTRMGVAGRRGAACGRPLAAADAPSHTQLEVRPHIARTRCFGRVGRPPKCGSPSGLRLECRGLTMALGGRSCQRRAASWRIILHIDKRRALARSLIGGWWARNAN